METISVGEDVGGGFLYYLYGEQYSFQTKNILPIWCSDSSIWVNTLGFYSIKPKTLTWNMSAHISVHCRARGETNPVSANGGMNKEVIAYIHMENCTII